MKSETNFPLVNEIMKEEAYLLNGLANLWCWFHSTTEMLLALMNFITRKKMPATPPKFCSQLSLPKEAVEDDIIAYNDTRRRPFALLKPRELEPDRPIVNYVSGQYLRRIIATENKKIRSKL